LSIVFQYFLKRIFSFYYAITTGAFLIPTGKNLVQAAILVVLSVGLLAAVIDRLQRREIVSMAFIVFNNLGHWGMLATLFFTPFPHIPLLLFSMLMVSGDLVKLAEIFRGSLILPGISKRTLLGLTLFYILGYTLILFIELI